ncbi:HAD family phosphatase [Conexibacter sp. DBS9H8]|uniref:HAD family hydrolase n=1 Tax=Conexibacter sp. DBS9H8 TaxID=2937801 RepID=UPI00200ED879|nr:HAD family hydrolase [Conexibacter sp. DBS9H8]
MPIELVIFDCDGVLIESERIAVEIDVAMLAEIGWELSREEVIERFMGRAYAHMLAEIEGFLGQPVPAEWVARWDETFQARLATELEPVDGVSETLDALHAAGYRTCVASSSNHASLERNLTATDLHDRLAGRIFSASEVTHGKPAPDLFLHAADRIGVAPERCVVVEDSRYGVAAARAAGMPVFAYTGGGMTPVATLEALGATVFAEMRDLPGLIAAL